MERDYYVELTVEVFHRTIVRAVSEEEAKSNAREFVKKEINYIDKTSDADTTYSMTGGDGDAWEVTQY